MEKGSENFQFGTGYFIHYRIVSAVKRLDFDSDKLRSIFLRSRWSNIIVLNVYAPSVEKSDDSKDSFYSVSSPGRFIPGSH
jgi:hypothetical protein